MAIMVATVTDRERKSKSVYSVRDFLIVDIDECGAGKHNCDANANCLDTKGSFACTCKPGYSGNGVNCTGNNSTLVVFIIFSYSTPFISH